MSNETIAWKICYTENGQYCTALSEHNSVGDYRAIDPMASSIALCAAPVSSEPVAWVRRHPDGALTSAFLEHAVIDPVRKDSGAWVPLYTAPVTAQPDLTQQTLDDVKAGIPARDEEIAALRKEIETLQAAQAQPEAYIRQRDPSQTGVGYWCAPGPVSEQQRTYVLRFEDADRGEAHFHDEDEAYNAFAAAEGRGWNCHLFAQMPRNRSAQAQQPVSGADGLPRLDENVRAALLYVLWHHQGGSSPVGQPIRRMLGIGQYDRMTPDQCDIARRVQSALSASAEPPPLLVCSETIRNAILHGNVFAGGIAAGLFSLAQEKGILPTSPVAAQALPHNIDEILTAVMDYGYQRAMFAKGKGSEDEIKRTWEAFKAVLTARAALAQQDAALHAEVLNMVLMLEANEWADHCGKSDLGRRLEWAITALQNRIAELTKSSNQQDADKVQADLLSSLVEIVDAVIASDEEGLIEHSEIIIKARAAIDAARKEPGQ